MSENELLACPFCGGKPRLEPDGGLISCESCGAQTSYYTRKERTIAEWNRRTPPALISPADVSAAERRDLERRLRALAGSEHDDLSVAEEAVEALEGGGGADLMAIHADLNTVIHKVRELERRIDNARASLAETDEGLARLQERVEVLEGDPNGEPLPSVRELAEKIEYLSDRSSNMDIKHGHLRDRVDSLETRDNAILSRFENLISDDRSRLAALEGEPDGEIAPSVRELRRLIKVHAARLLSVESSIGKTQARLSALEAAPPRTVELTMERAVGWYETVKALRYALSSIDGHYSLGAIRMIANHLDPTGELWERVKSG